MYEVQFHDIVHVNGSVIINTTLIGALTKINNTYLSNFTKFVVIEHKVYFGVGNIIGVLNFLDSTQSRFLSTEFPASCQIHEIVSAKCAKDQSNLLVYCTDRYYVYLHLKHEDWSNTQLFVHNGVPYPCPDNNYRAALIINGSDALHFSQSNLLLNTIAINVNI